MFLRRENGCPEVPEIRRGRSLSRRLRLFRRRPPLQTLFPNQIKSPSSICLGCFSQKLSDCAKYNFKYRQGFRLYQQFAPNHKLPFILLLGQSRLLGSSPDDERTISSIATQPSKSTESRYQNSLNSPKTSQPFGYSYKPSSTQTLSSSRWHSTPTKRTRSTLR